MSSLVGPLNCLAYLGILCIVQFVLTYYIHIYIFFFFLHKKASISVRLSSCRFRDEVTSFLSAKCRYILFTGEFPWDLEVVNKLRGKATILELCDLISFLLDNVSLETCPGRQPHVWMARLTLFFFINSVHLI